MSFIKIDFGCGQNKVSPEHVGVDFVQVDGVNVVHDLTQYPYPFEDGVAEEIYASHFFEHLDGFQRVKFMEECYRILIAPQKDEYGNVVKVGKIRLIHPYGKSIRFFQDFSHKWPPIVETSYLYFNKGWRDANKLTHGHYDIKCDYDFIVNYAWQDPTIAGRNTETQQFWAGKYWDTVGDLIVDLTKR